MDDLLGSLHALISSANPDQRVIVGITGPPGAGKSTLARALVERMNADSSPGIAAYVPMDGFHLSNAQLSAHGLSDRKGAPETFDVPGYLALLERCRREPGPVFAPDYSRTLHEPVAAALTVDPSARVVITEGNYLLFRDGAWARVREHLDQAWFIDASDAELRERLITRHQLSKQTDDPEGWYESVDKPNIELVRSTAHLADRRVRI